MNSTGNLELQHLYKLNKLRLIELNGIDEEILFFKELLETHFLNYLSDLEKDNGQFFSYRLSRVNHVKSLLTKEAIILQDNLASKIYNEENKTCDLYQPENDRLAEEVSVLTKTFNTLKEEIISMNEIASIKEPNSSI